MKITRSLCTGGAALLTAALALAFAPESRANFDFTVTINVASLVSNPNGPFSLDLQLADGSGLANSDNTVTISNFVFTGGSATGTPTFTSGGESGSFASSVVLTNSAFDNEFAQAFSSGVTQIQFTVDETSTVDTTPEQFNVAIFDNNFMNITTTNPDSSDTLIESAIIRNETIGSVKTFSSTGTNGGVTASVAAAVPEPGSAAMLLVGALGFFARRGTFRRA